MLGYEIVFVEYGVNNEYFDTFDTLDEAKKYCEENITKFDEMARGLKLASLEIWEGNIEQECYTGKYWQVKEYQNE